MAVPFRLSFAITVSLFNQFKDKPSIVQIKFLVFILIIGMVIAITISYILLLNNNLLIL